MGGFRNGVGGARDNSLSKERFLSHVVTDNQTQFLGLMDHIWIRSFALLLVHLAPPVRAS